MAGRMSGFALSMAISTLAGILSVFLLVHFLGQDWGKLALIQTTCQLPAVLVAFGWGATGATTVAGLPARARGAFHRQSIRARVMLMALVAPITAVVLTVMLRGDVALAVLGSLAYLVPALSTNWFFTGIAQPSRLLMFDTIPATIGVIGGVIAGALTSSLLAVLACNLLGNLAAVVIGNTVVARTHPRITVPLDGIGATLLAQRHAVVTSATSTLYVSLPLIAVNWFIPSALTTYAMADRLFRYASLAMLPFQQFFQGWVPEDPDQLTARARKATLAALGISVIGAASIALLSPIASRWLGVPVPWDVAILLGIAFIGIGVAAIAGYACLVSVGKTQTLAYSTVLGAAIGAPLIIISAMAGSLALIAASVAVTELAVGAYQLIVLRRALRDRDNQRRAIRESDRAT